MKKVIQKIFSLRNEKSKKVLTILGLSIRFDNPKWYKRRSHQDEESIKISYFFDNFQNVNEKKVLNKNFDVNNYVSKLKNQPKYLKIDTTHNYI